MLAIPYEKQIDENACALACYTMVAKYFFPTTTAEEVAQISGHEPNYVVWEFKFWLWLLDKNIAIDNYDTIDYALWATEGIEGLKKSLPEKEFNFYKANTKDLGAYQSDIQKLLAHKNFHHYRGGPTYDRLVKAVAENKVCAVVLDSHALYDEKGFDLHQVVVLSVNDDEVIYHDPSPERGPNQKIDKTKFVRAWLDTVSEPSLCIYYQNK